MTTIAEPRRAAIPPIAAYSMPTADELPPQVCPGGRTPGGRYC